jgi:hypothetical protein
VAVVELEAVGPADNNPLEGDDGPFAPSCKDVHESPFYLCSGRLSIWPMLGVGYSHAMNSIFTGSMFGV